MANILFKTTCVLQILTVVFASQIWKLEVIQWNKTEHCKYQYLLYRFNQVPETHVLVFVARLLHFIPTSVKKNMVNTSVFVVEVQQCCKTYDQHHTWLSVEESLANLWSWCRCSPWSHQFRALESSNSIPCQLASWRMLDLVGLSVPQLNQLMPTLRGSKLKTSLAWKKYEQLPLAFKI